MPCDRLTRKRPRNTVYVLQHHSRIHGTVLVCCRNLPTFLFSVPLLLDGEPVQHQLRDETPTELHHLLHRTPEKLRTVVLIEGGVGDKLCHPLREEADDLDLAHQPPFPRFEPDLPAFGDLHMHEDVPFRASIPGQQVARGQNAFNQRLQRIGQTEHVHHLCSPTFEKLLPYPCQQSCRQLDLGSSFPNLKPRKILELRSDGKVLASRFRVLAICLGWLRRDTASLGLTVLDSLTLY